MLFAQPRRKDFATKAFMKVHFLSFCVVSECAFLSLKSKKGEYIKVAGHALRLGLQVLIFKYSLKLRDGFARLPDKDLSNFLVETLFKDGFRLLAPILFVLFRSIKCVLESGLSACTKNALCA